jgi:hypothetical protein
MTDRSDATVITVRSTAGGTRYVFEPRSDGDHTMYEKTLTKGGDWRTVGKRIVSEVTVENA